MDYKEVIRHISSTDEEYILLSNVCDKVNICKIQNILTSTKFLDSRQLALVKQLLMSIRWNSYIFDGGTSEAERMIALFKPDYPVTDDLLRYIRIEKSSRDSLRHRDYLGSLMGIGVINSKLILRQSVYSRI